MPGGRVAIEVLRARDLLTLVEEKETTSRIDDEDEDEDASSSPSSSPVPPRVPGGTARARARLLEAAGYKVLALDASKWLALRQRRGEGEGEGEGGGREENGGEERARDRALAALLRPLLVSSDDDEN